MSWVTPSSRSTGNPITAAIWNADCVSNPIALRTGGIAIASQAALDHVYASSSSQLGRLAKGSAYQAVRLNSDASAYEFYSPAAVSFGTYTPSLTGWSATVQSASFTLYQYEGGDVALVLHVRLISGSCSSPSTCEVSLPGGGVYRAADYCSGAFALAISGTRMCGRWHAAPDDTTINLEPNDPSKGAWGSDSNIFAMIEAKIPL